MNILQDLYDTLTYPARCNCATANWFAFLVVLLIASFLWTKVVGQIE